MSSSTRSQLFVIIEVGTWVVTGSEHPSVIRNIYFELVRTVRLDNGKSHACQWKLSESRTQVVLLG